MTNVTHTGIGFLLLFFMVVLPYSSDRLGEDEYIMFYHSYGYLDGDEWVIPMRVYVYEYRHGVQQVVTGFMRRTRDLSDEQADMFHSRITDFVVDSESRETVLFLFDNDPENEILAILNEEGAIQRTNLNGIIEGEIRLSEERAGSILAAQNRDDGWLKIRAVSERHEGTGYIKLIPPQGTSIISDVDDTVKITEIPAGSGIMIRNTFFKEFTAAPGMAEMYREFGDDVFFHYVSGSPWQLFRTLSVFLFSEEAGFPMGTFHMKRVTKNFLSLNTWRDLRELTTNENVTFDQKVGQITQLFEHFPKRNFILIGDSGETDPEVFSVIRDIFPTQVKEIYIRDVVNARELAPERLEGMNIIPAPTILPGISQFDG